MDETGAVEAVEIENHEMTHFAGVEARLNLNPSQGSFLSNVSMNSCLISHTRFARMLVYTLLIVTSIPFIAGAAFTSIFIEDGNYNAAVVAFFTACLSLGSASIFLMHLLRILEKYHDQRTLEELKVLGMITSVASGIALGVYTILTFFNKQAFNLHGENFFSSAIFALICLATSVELYIVAQWYQNALNASDMAARVAAMEINSYSVRPTTSAVMN
ncbi:unnamed protein product [Larinioides sclopetarius]|uniref:Transmembrane protein n=1 Tax=Larinioides sclopetarius TaxID=280406 RepID=A0AAV1ZKT0_9ARAC